MEIAISLDEESWEGELKGRKRDDSLFDFQISANIVRSKSGSPICTMASFEDITERKQAEEALRIANKKLNLLGSITGHDILNQLTVMMGYKDLMKESLKDERLLDFLSKIGKAGENVKQMLEFRREYDRIVAEEPEWVNVAEIINRVAADLPFRDVSLTIDLDSLGIFSDPLIGKVFYNLLQNSLQHGGDLAKIRVYHRRTGDGITLIIEDDGVGVPEKEKESIFEYGYGKHRGYGLYHIKEILSIYQMNIKETGTPGEGARFEIRIPHSRYRFSG